MYGPEVDSTGRPTKAKAKAKAPGGREKKRKASPDAVAAIGDGETDYKVINILSSCHQLTLFV